MLSSRSLTEETDYSSLTISKVAPLAYLLSHSFANGMTKMFSNIFLECTIIERNA